MGDSETVVAQPSVVMVYASEGYTSTEHANNAPDTVTSVTGVSEDPVAHVPTDGVDIAASTDDMDAVTSVAQGQSAGDNLVDNKDQISAQNEIPNNLNYDDSQNLTESTNVSMDTSQVNGIGVTEAKRVISASINENGITSDVHEPMSEHQMSNVSALSAEEERLWSMVRANSLDFDAWTALIDETEKAMEGLISKIRKVYDAFLAEFPLCYGYWKKYADHEERLGSVDKVVEVYERAVQGVTYSVDMWLHFCVFAINTYGDPVTVRSMPATASPNLFGVKVCGNALWKHSFPDVQTLNLRLFERGLAYVGTDYLSFTLWDKYIEYEYSQQEWSRLAMIYTRILENPNQQIDRYFNSFRELVAHRPLSELRTAEEAAATTAATVADTGRQEFEGEVNPNAVEQSPKPVSSGLTGAEELERYIAIREEMYKKAKEFHAKIVGFETAIRRPYFHVRPLNGGELENWHNYLDFIEAEDDLNKVVKLYERCLIACANYPEYWIRYVLCMEGSGSMDLAENALARATQVFVKRQPEIHLFAARFSEHSGDIPRARAAYYLVHTEISPGLLEAIIRHANMEHRLGNVEDACSLYEQAIAIEKGKEHSQTLPFLFAQYSRFVYLVAGNADKAREIVDKALETCQISKPLLEAIIHLESILSLPKRIDYLDSVVNKFVVPTPDNPSSASIIEREELSSIFLEFLDHFGDARSIKKADDRHAKLFLHHKSTSDSKKHHAEDYLLSDKTKLAKSGVVSSSPSVMGAYQSTQNQWPAGYGQPQAWPQGTQAQGQNWNPAYTQQAAYGAYGNAYTTPQVPTSVPQTAAYAAAYPTTYPVQQAYPQQSYAQTGTPAPLNPVQQPAAVAPQAYYGTYY